MDIEWDEQKRERTLAERGVDFADVEHLEWPLALTREDSRNNYGERRFVTLGPIRGRLCVLVWCERNGAMRIISLRKANQRERRAYDRGV
ncbi:BrnT family toxin [Sulfitobacter mediterraneus]|uniref:BrnT family toxin n=1 Tax=Sulfitobacter mediterraneus TaxID=83219 RepID=UPI001933E36A|nr:BrnT family toxin [Sulfitobacter mediterraneus]MBM1309422.1 BrnT family toxin [Sulfitobacter mediterraneus]MBM1313307.1 BrnT family toxin [Sulfitobacter mediterraneus]MBM1321691.1 BrnT family toxin [Sulfitobacter mediterraneus]MBM1325578.1 BrnT family toxin [Sulfitobacter mediterraneus]MBM1396924.1 BrnT family toxin [Sulfitobacter mediterraneus]